MWDFVLYRPLCEANHWQSAAPVHTTNKQTKSIIRHISTIKTSTLQCWRCESWSIWCIRTQRAYYMQLYITWINTKTGAQKFRINQTLTVLAVIDNINGQQSCYCCNEIEFCEFCRQLLSVEPSFSFVTMAFTVQESCAIAKMAAQCALYMGALKISGLPDYAHGYFFPKFYGLLFRWHRLREHW